MRTQCKRIYSALPSQCDRICNGRCEPVCVGDASPESRVQSAVNDKGSGLAHTHLPLTANRSTDPVTSSVLREVWHHLTEGLRWLSANDFGRDWPLPDRSRLRQLIAEFDDDLCRRAAREAREIAVRQDRAPNITSLFEKKLRDLAEEERHRQKVRGELHKALGVAA